MLGAVICSVLKAGAVRYSVLNAGAVRCSVGSVCSKLLAIIELPGGGGGEGAGQTDPEEPRAPLGPGFSYRILDPSDWIILHNWNNAGWEVRKDGEGN